MKDDYDRRTRRASTAELPPALREALVRAAADVQIADLDQAATLLVETHARRTRAAGFFARVLGADPDVEHWCALAVAPSAVIVGTFGEKRGTWARTLPISTLELESLPAAVAGELGERTVMLSSPALASYVSGQAPAARGSFAVIFASAADAQGARAAVEEARAAYWARERG